MSPRFHRRGKLRRLSVGFASLVAPAAVLALLALPAPAQTIAPPGQSGRAIEPMQPPKDLPRAQQGDRTRNLDFLFGALKAAPDADSAKQVEARIWALWTASGSDTANLLMTRAKTAIEASDLDLAIESAELHRQAQARLCRGLEPARDAALHAQGLRRLAR